MKIAVFGATGMIGCRIALEAIDRGHTVTAVVRNPADLIPKLVLCRPHLIAKRGNVLEPLSIATVSIGHDAIISAIGRPPQGDSHIVVQGRRMR